MKDFLKRFTHDLSGTSTIEYGLIAALLALVMIGGMMSLSGKMEGVFSQAASAQPVD